MLCLMVWLAVGHAFAQSGAAPAAPASDADVSDRAKRAADKVFQWIKLHSDQPRKPAARAEPAAKTADKPRDETSAARRAASRDDAAKPAAAADDPARPRAARPAAAGVTADPPATLVVTPAPANEPGAGSAAAVAALPGGTQPPELPAATRVLAPDPQPPAAALEAAAAERAADELVLVHRVDPKFGAALMQQMRRGSAEVRFQVLPDGSVGSAEVVNSTSVRLHGTVLDAVRQWRFAPLRQARAVAVELGFNLD
jgi:TonB family protein